ncbi:hypothetical protein SUGI_0633010 [Cryptomeria japonica]|nr:hypothetical protein SUGI_0633010 [Cryptomeria japonica]
MQYLQATLCESMRLYPPIPSDTKQASGDDELPDEMVVRKGMRVIYHPYAMGRMESIWGSNCLEFKPERWFNKMENEMAFIQMKSIAASIIEEFSLQVDREWNPKYVAMITAKMEKGLPVRVVKRPKNGP